MDVLSEELNEVTLWMDNNSQSVTGSDVEGRQT